MSIFSVLRRSYSLTIVLTVALLSSLLFVVLAAEKDVRAQELFAVDSVYDEPDDDPGDGECAATVPASTVPTDTDTIEACTLRAAVQEANASGGPDTIEVPAGHYELDEHGASEDAAETGDLDITDTVTITGLGPDVVQIDGKDMELVSGTAEAAQDPPDRIFHIHNDIDVDISGATIRRGIAGEAPNNTPTCGDPTLFCNGGGILIQDSDASLTLSDSVLRDNIARNNASTAGEGNGAAIYSAPGATNVDVSLNDTVVRENRNFKGCCSVHGAIHLDGAGSTLSLQNTSVLENRGGGITMGGEESSLTVGDASHVSRNHKSDAGGHGIELDGPGSSLNVQGSFVDQNRARGIVSTTDTVSVTIGEGSRVAGNRSTGVLLRGDETELNVSDSEIGGAFGRLFGVAFVGGNLMGGIVVDGPGSTIDISNSQINGNLSGGLLFGTASGDYITATIDGSSFNNNLLQGIGATMNTDLTVTDSDVFDNTRGGIWVRAFNCTDDAEICINGPTNNQFVTLDNVNVSRNGVRGMWIVEQDVSSEGCCGDFVGDGDQAVGARVDVSNSTFEKNNVGGIHAMDNGAVLRVTDTMITNNRNDYGGGIAIGSQDVADGAQDNVIATVHGSTIAHNNAGDEGGGIWNDGDLTVVNSTISTNVAENDENLGPGGGGLFNDSGGTTSLEYVTMYRNQTTLERRTCCPGPQVREFAEGEAIYNGASASDVQVTATIVALEITTTQAPYDLDNRENCAGADPTSNGDNFEDYDTCNFNQPSDETFTPPDLFALRDNGGETFTHMPEPGSPAIDNDPDCSEEDDQRNLPRPSGDDCDTGAVEVQGEENEPTGCGADFCVNNEYDHQPGVEILQFDPEDCDNDPEDPSPEDPDEGCTLREAVVAANQTPGEDSIFVPSEDYFLLHEPDEGPIILTNEDASHTGDLDITETVTIEGEGRGESVIDARYTEFLAFTDPDSCCTFSDDEPGDRVLHVPEDEVDLELDGLTVREGRATESTEEQVDCGDDVNGEPLDCRGGGILFEGEGNLSLFDVLVLNNRTGMQEGTFTGNGGGIYFRGGDGTELTVEGSQIAGNKAGDRSHGGGIFVANDGTSVDVLESIIGGETRGDVPGGLQSLANQAGDDADGGGIYLRGDEISLNVEDSLFMGNKASIDNGPGGRGGGLFVNGADNDINISFTPFEHNKSGDGGLGGGGIYLDGDDASVFIEGSTFDRNMAEEAADDVDGGFSFEGEEEEGGRPGDRGTGEGGEGHGGRPAHTMDNEGAEAEEPGTGSEGGTVEPSGKGGSGGRASSQAGPRPTSHGTVLGGGGAINIARSADVEIVDSDILRNNTSDCGVGGGIFIGEAAGGVTLSIDGGQVAYNKSDSGENNCSLDDDDVFDRSMGGGFLFSEDGGAEITVSNVEFLQNRTDGAGGVFSLFRGDLTVSGSTFHLGRGDDRGGAIHNNGTTTVEDSLFTENSQDEDDERGGGGAIFNDDEGRLTLRTSEIVDSYSDDSGGDILNRGRATLEDVWLSYGNTVEGGSGIRNYFEFDDEDDEDPGDMLLDGVTISDGWNDEEDESQENGEDGGGAILNEGNLEIVNSTLSRNLSSDTGGAIFNDSTGELDLRHVTIYDNETDLEDRPFEGGAALIPGKGVAIYNEDNSDDGEGVGQITSKASIVAKSEGENCEMDGNMNSQGFNIEDQDTCGFDHASDQVNTDPELGELDDNGGFTLTHLPLDGSPAIDNVDEECPPPDVDQRDFGRPEGTDCDTGSVEAGAEEAEPPDDGDGGGGGGGRAEELDVEPEDADNTLPEDDDHTVSAEVDGDQGEEVDFKIISGPNADGGNTVDFSCDPSGADDTCEATYTSNGENGTDVICGWVDTDDDDVFNATGSDSDGGDCGDEQPDESESNDDTDVVEKGWTGGRTPSPRPTDTRSPTESPSPSPRPTPTEGPCAPRPGYNVINGTSGDDVIVGTDGNDLICARAGDDVVRGRRGNDIIFLGSGADEGFGGRGQDQINGNRGRDDINGNRGGDDISGGRGRDVIAGNIGPDTLHGNIGNDRLFGGPGPDFLGGGPDRDRCRGGPGVDQKNNCEF